MDTLDFTFEIKGTTPADEGWDATGTVTLRYGADDFIPMVQRAISIAFNEVATGAAPIAGPYQITELTLSAMLPAEAKQQPAKKKKADG